MRKNLVHSVIAYGALLRARMHPQNIYAMEEYAANAKFYPRKNFPLYGHFHPDSWKFTPTK